jgi:hypothetical protein
MEQPTSPFPEVSVVTLNARIVPGASACLASMLERDGISVMLTVLRRTRGWIAGPYVLQAALGPSQRNWPTPDVQVWFTDSACVADYARALVPIGYTLTHVHNPKRDTFVQVLTMAHACARYPVIYLNVVTALVPNFDIVLLQTWCDGEAVYASESALSDMRARRLRLNDDCEAAAQRDPGSWYRTLRRIVAFEAAYGFTVAIPLARWHGIFEVVLTAAETDTAVSGLRHDAFQAWNRLALMSPARLVPLAFVAQGWGGREYVAMSVSDARRHHRFFGSLTKPERTLARRWWPSRFVQTGLCVVPLAAPGPETCWVDGCLTACTPYLERDPNGTSRIVVVVGSKGKGVRVVGTTREFVRKSCRAACEWVRAHEERSTLVRLDLVSRLPTFCRLHDLDAMIRSQHNLFEFSPDLYPSRSCTPRMPVYKVRIQQWGAPPPT